MILAAFITGLILGAVFGYRLRARLAMLDAEAQRIEARREPWECKECGI